MFLDVIGIFISILAICSMVAVIGLKKRLDEQTVVLKKILNAIQPIDDPLKHASNKEEQQLKKHEITKEGDKYIFDGESYADLKAAEAKAEEKLMEKYGITKAEDKFKFKEYSYAKLSDAVAYAELQKSKNKTY